MALSANNKTNTPLFETRRPYDATQIEMWVGGEAYQVNAPVKEYIQDLCAHIVKCEALIRHIAVANIAFQHDDDEMFMTQALQDALFDAEKFNKDGTL